MKDSQTLNTLPILYHENKYGLGQYVPYVVSVSVNHKLLHLKLLAAEITWKAYLK